jgi:hypothetical protein
MKRPKPSTVAGGGEINFVTCSLDSAENSAGASPAHSSRTLTRFPVRHGSPVRQSLATTGGVCNADSVGVGSRCDW